MSKVDTTPVCGSAAMWRRRALEAEDALKDALSQSSDLNGILLGDLEASEARIRELEEEKIVLTEEVGRNAEALGFLQGSAPARFIGRPLAEFAAYRIRELEAALRGLHE